MPFKSPMHAVKLWFDSNNSFNLHMTSLMTTEHFTVKKAQNFAVKRKYRKCYNRLVCPLLELHKNISDG